MQQIKKAFLMTGIRIAVFLVLFAISYNILNVVLNRGNTDLTADMPSASLPIVYMNVNNMKINALHGYTSQMEGNYLRGNITPINADRTLDITIDTFGTSIAKVGYEVRNLECSRLIENQELDSFVFNDNIITVKLSLKDLIDDDKEYMLIVKLTNGNGDIYSYYGRIINTTELSLVDKIGFCMDFSDKTFDQGKAPELKTYMESNSHGDNSSYAHVDIHSSYNQLSWGNLHPELVGEKSTNLIYIDSVNACVEILYRVKIKEELYNVKEYFRVRKGTKRMYLMEYERTMNQIITNEEKLVINGKIINGIVNEDIQMMESRDNGVVSFVQQDALYSLNTQTGSLSRIFSFRDSENDDMRTNYDGSDIKIMSVDETGNVNFIVYGYMSRGRHEGQVGVALYRYDAVVNTIEEKIFIPYTKSHEILKEDIEKLSYINSRNRLYILMDGTVYSINLESNETETVASNLDENRFVSSKMNNIIAWQTGDTIRDFTSIQFYSLDQQAPKVLNSGPGAIIIPLGFIGEDLIYGTADTADITVNGAGRPIIPMYKISIEGINGEILKEYGKPNVYVIDTELSDEMVKLHRVSKDNENNSYYEIDEDQILNSASGAMSDNLYKSVITEEMETTYQIVLAKEMKSGNLKIMTPKEIIIEENRDILLSDKDTKDRYYTYARGQLSGIYTDVPDAIIDAEEQFGVVVNKNMDYIWESGHRKTSAKLETVGGSALTEEQINSGVTPLAMCIEEMLEYKDVFKDVDNLLSDTENPMSVLKKNLPDMEVLDLSGCSLDSVLYFVSRGYPVLTMTEGNSAALIVGYDSKNTILYTPVTGETYKMGLNDTKAYFDSCGNRYIGYIE